MLVPTMTFAATAEVVTYFKAKPILIDCVQDTLNLDTDRIEEAITDKDEGDHSCPFCRPTLRYGSNPVYRSCPWPARD